RTTVSPPIPESNTPMARFVFVFIGCSSRVNLIYTRSHASATFIGSVVGFLNVLPTLYACGAASSPPRYPLNANGY
ncbi:MAG: hypothetical protein WC373_15930, partial [Smithella sp.]